MTFHEGTQAINGYGTTLPLTSEIEGDGWLTSYPAALTPGITRYSLYRRMGESQGRFGRVRTNSRTPVFDIWTLQPVASPCIDYAIPDHIKNG